MGLLDRLFNRDETPVTPTDLAIPLTPQEVATLVEGFRKADRGVALDRRTWAHEPGIHLAGSHVCRDFARRLSQRAGFAVALGYQTVPVPTFELDEYDHVISALDGSRTTAPVVRSLEMLLTRMHILAGMALVRGWRVERRDGGMVWHPQEPDVASLPDYPQIEGQRTR